MKESSATIIIELRAPEVKNSAISEKSKNNKHMYTCRYDTVPYTLTQSLFKALPPEKRWGMVRGTLLGPQSRLRELAGRL